MDVENVEKTNIEKLLKKMSMLLDDIEDMICSAEPEVKNDLLYIYSEIEDMYNMLRKSKM